MLSSAIVERDCRLDRSVSCIHHGLLGSRRRLNDRRDGFHSALGSVDGRSVSRVELPGNDIRKGQRDDGYRWQIVNMRLCSDGDRKGQAVRTGYEMILT